MSSGGSIHGLSLVEAVIKSHKTINLTDALTDARYCAAVDGITAPHCPHMTVPLRGRGGAVVGTVIIVRGSKGNAFSSEDIIAAEMVASFASISLYWCQSI